MVKTVILKGLEKSSLNTTELKIYNFVANEIFPYFVEKAHEIGSNGIKKSVLSFNYEWGRLLACLSRGKTEGDLKFPKFEQLQKVFSVIYSEGYKLPDMIKGCIKDCIFCPVQKGDIVYLQFATDDYIRFDSEKAEELNKKASYEKAKKAAENEKITAFMEENNLSSKTLAKAKIKEEEEERAKEHARELEFKATIETIKTASYQELLQIIEEVEKRREFFNKVDTITA